MLDPTDGVKVQPETRQQKATMMSRFFMNISHGGLQTGLSVRPPEGQRWRERIVQSAPRVLNPAWRLHETLLKSPCPLGYSRPARAIANKART